MNPYQKKYMANLRKMPVQYAEHLRKNRDYNRKYRQKIKERQNEKIQLKIMG